MGNTLTIGIAAAGTPELIQDSNKITSSIPGHIWYTVTDTNGTSYSFGKSPIQSGDAFGPGIVNNDDPSIYLGRHLSQTVPISDSQAKYLIEYGKITTGISAGTIPASAMPSFNPIYNVAGGFVGIQGIYGQNCESYVAAALKYASEKATLPIPINIQAVSFPAWQGENVKAILDAIQAQNGGETINTTRSCGDHNELTCTITGRYGPADPNGNRQLLSDTWTASNGTSGLDSYRGPGSFESSITYKDKSSSFIYADGSSITETDRDASGAVIKKSALDLTSSIGESYFTDHGGNKIVDQVKFNDLGSIQYKKTLTTDSSGRASASVSGSGATLEINNGTITLEKGSSGIVVTGSNNKISLGGSLGINASGRTTVTLNAAGTQLDAKEDTNSDGRVDRLETLTLDTAGNSMASLKVLDAAGKTIEERTYQRNSTNGISLLQHFSNGTMDSKGLIIGEITQSKLDQFSQLSADLTLSASILAPSAAPLKLTAPQASILISDFGFGNGLNTITQPYINDFFTSAQPINNLAAPPTNYGNYITNSVTQAVDDAATPNIPGSSTYTPLPQDFLANLTNISFGGAPTVIPDLGTLIAPITLTPTIPTPSFGGLLSLGFIDPLILNLAGAQVHTTKLGGSNVLFDMDASGKKSKTGWITPDEGFLVRDKNGNGTIDSVSEMFSERTSGTAASGFSALAELDSNHDGKIDSNDANFSQIGIWIDKNVDGVSQKDEIATLAKIGIASINVAAKAKNIYDNGNVILNEGTFNYTNGRAGDISEALFNYGDNSDLSTVYISDQSSAVKLKSGKSIAILSGSDSQDVNATRSGIDILIGGQDDTITAGTSPNALLIGNGKTTLIGNSNGGSFVINGDKNKILTSGGKNIITAYGDNNSINANSGTSKITATGNNYDVSVKNGNTITFNGQGNTIKAETKNTITLEKNSSLRIAAGAYNTISLKGSNGLQAPSYNTISVAGTNNTITTKCGFINISDNAGASVFGNSNTITAKNYGQIYSDGTLNKISAESNNSLEVSGIMSTISTTGIGNSLRINDSSSKASVSMNGGTISIGTYNSASVSGSGNTITTDANVTLRLTGNQSKLTSAGAGTRFVVTGTDNVFSLNNGSASLSDGSSATLVGNSNTVSLSMQDTLRAVGTGNAITAVSQSGKTGTGDSVSIFGPSNTVSGLASTQVRALSSAQANGLISAMSSFVRPAAGPISVLASSQQPQPVLIAALA